MPTELTIDVVNEYFSNLNPIAEKISHDINETKSSYEHIWEELNLDQQIDIINETLIKPEISLRYFDNFSTPSSSIASSAISLINPISNDDFPRKSPKTKQPAKLKLTTKYIYKFDGKNLSTFANQKTGLKSIHDDASGAKFRDEHSVPFSCKTASQINLKLFQDDTHLLSKSMHSATIPSNVIESMSSSMTEMHPASLQKYQKVQNELANSIINKNLAKSKNLSSKQPSEKKAMEKQSIDMKNFDKLDGKYERFYDDGKKSNDAATNGTSRKSSVIMNANELNELSNDSNAANKSGNFLSKLMSKNNSIFNAGTNLMNKSLMSASGHLDFDDDYNEGLNLMKNASYSGLTSSSSAPSEEEEHEEDKTVCEDSKLLLDSDDLRKGFDFLNNW